MVSLSCCCKNFYSFIYVMYPKKFDSKSVVYFLFSDMNCYCFFSMNECAFPFELKFKCMKELSLSRKDECILKTG